MGVQRARVACTAVVVNVQRAPSGELVRHVFLVNGLLDGVVLEVDAVCCHGDERRSLCAPPVFFWSAQVGQMRTEKMVHTARGDPTHQATWEAFMVLPAISPTLRGKRNLGRKCFWCLVRHDVDVGQLHLSPFGHELVGIHV